MTSSEPSKTAPPQEWEHHTLWKNVKEALYSLPSFFRTATHIEGIAATDIFTLNTVLGAAIENQVVQTLNQMRSVWDPDENYLPYSFVRQSQTFPDVLLRRPTIGESQTDDIIMGIELKGWYLLAKEGEPSGRFQVTPAACAPQDLIVIVPWVLDNVISGAPRVLSPYVESSLFFAEYRNYYWTVLRDTNLPRDITHPTDITPYPTKSDRIIDVPASDKGGNFGRFARTRLMDTYFAQMQSTLLCGIRAEHWLSFFQLFRDREDTARIKEAIDGLRKQLSQPEQTSQTYTHTILAILDELQSLVQNNPN